MIILILEALLIVASVSMDSFVSGFAYGIKKIRIPLSSVIVISLICSSVLAVSLLLGNVLSPYIHEGVTTALCFVILFGLGLSKIFDSALKAYIRKRSSFRKSIKFSAFNLGFILNVYANPEDADQDKSKVLMPREAVPLSIALSFDGLAVGFGAGITETNPLIVMALSLALNVLGVIMGCFLGNKVVQKTSLDLSWLSGAMLMILAVIKLF